MKSRVRAMAPGFSFSFFSVVIATGSGIPAFKEPSAIAWSERHDVISVARSPAVAAVARVAVPRTIKQLRPVAAHLSRLVEEDALRHQCFGAALRYQCDFRAHELPASRVAEMAGIVVSFAGEEIPAR